MRNTMIVTAVLALLVVTGFGAFSFLDGDIGCEWEQVEVEGETFDNLQEFEDRAEEEGVNLEDSDFDNLEFENRDDGLYVRTEVCGTVSLDE